MQISAKNFCNPAEILQISDDRRKQKAQHRLFALKALLITNELLQKSIALQI